MNGGLFLAQGFEAAQDLGIIPKGAIMIAISDNPAAISKALQSTPLVQGSIVDDGWFNPSLKNGCLDHSAKFTDRYGAHATALVGVLTQGTNVFYLSMNSWGFWGWNGLFVVESARHDDTSMIDGPYTATMPAGWEKDEGWKKYVVSRGTW